MRVGIIYEHTPAVTQLVRTFDDLMTAQGWQVETDYRNQNVISEAGWVLAYFGVLARCDVYLCVETKAGVNARVAGKTRGLTDELAFLSTSAKPMARAIADPWLSMSPEQISVNLKSVTDDLEYRLGPIGEATRASESSSGERE